MAKIYGDPNLRPTLLGHQKAENQTIFGIDDILVNTLLGDVDQIA